MSDSSESRSDDDTLQPLQPVKTNDFEMMPSSKTTRASSGSRGKALLFNFEFKGEGKRERKGSTKDMEDLRGVFQGMGYTVVAPEAPTKKNITKELKKVSKEDRSNWDSLVVAVMTHGTQKSGSLFLMDEQGQEYLADELWKDFDVSDWLDIPKLYFIQACQGDDPQPPAAAAKDASAAIEMDAMPVSFPARGRNFLFAFSTIPEWASFRNQSAGSWFIQSLCKAIEENPHNEIHSVLTIVNFKVSEKEGEVYDLRGKPKKVKQMSCFSSTLTQPFYFDEEETADNRSQLDNASLTNAEEQQRIEKALKSETKKVEKRDKELAEKQSLIEQLRTENEYKHLNNFLRKQWFNLKEERRQEGTMGAIIPIENHPWIVKKVPGEHYLHDPQDLEIMLNFKNKFVLAVHAYYRDQENDEICLVLPRADIGSFLQYVIDMEKRLSNPTRVGASTAVSAGDATIDEAFFNEDSIWNFLWNMAAALNYLHEQFNRPHGSVNPRNIFGVREANGTICWKLAKYGLKLSKEDDMKDYFAPEVKRNQARSKEADIYSLGAVLKFYIGRGDSPFHKNERKSSLHSTSSLTRGKPQQRGSIEHQKQDIEMIRELRKKAKKMMHKDSEERPTAKDLARKEKK